MKRTRTLFKLALHYCKQREEQRIISCISKCKGLRIIIRNTNDDRAANKLMRIRLTVVMAMPPHPNVGVKLKLHWFDVRQIRNKMNRWNLSLSISKIYTTRSMSTILGVLSSTNYVSLYHQISRKFFTPVIVVAVKLPVINCFVFVLFIAHVGCTQCRVETITAYIVCINT